MNNTSEELVNKQANEFPSVDGLWRWAALCAAVNNNKVEGPDVQRIIVDSRQARAGDLFVALSGDPGVRFNPSYRSQVDGHDFVVDAVDKGAVGALVSRPVAPANGTAEVPQLSTTDTYDGLWMLGAAGRQRFTQPVVAITGSSGKTTAKYYFSEAMAAFTPPGSFNNHIGVPLALANTPASAPGAVYEIGTNHPGEIEPLAELAKPDIAVVLNVHSAHIENFPNWQALYQEKISIFNALDNKDNAISEDEMALSFGYKFGTTPDADARVMSINNNNNNDKKDHTAEIMLFNQRYTVKVPGGGLYRAKSVAAALLTCRILGVSLDRAINLGELGVPKGRGNRLIAGGIGITDESYNANPDSMRATLENFAAQRVQGRKVVIVGEMLELGEHSASAHLDLAAQLQVFDRVLCVGEGARGLAEALQAPWFATAEETLGAPLAEFLNSGDEVLVKGSNRVFWAHDYVARLAGLLS